MTLQRAQRLFAQVCASLLAPLPTSSCDRSIPEAIENTRDAVEHCCGGCLYMKNSHIWRVTAGKEKEKNLMLLTVQCSNI